jgi:hypothetical protein
MVRWVVNLHTRVLEYLHIKLFDEDGQLRATVDQIMNKYGSLIK